MQQILPVEQRFLGEKLKKKNWTEYTLIVIKMFGLMKHMVHPGHSLGKFDHIFHITLVPGNACTFFPHYQVTLLDNVCDE